LIKLFYPGSHDLLALWHFAEGLFVYKLFKKEGFRKNK